MAVTAVASAQLRETHNGVVVLCGDRAYKTKKPIATDFLDFSIRTADQTRSRAPHSSRGAGLQTQRPQQQGRMIIG